MRRIVPVLSLSFVAALAACGESPQPVASDGGIEALSVRVADRYVVVFSDDVRDVRGAAAEIARGNGFGLQRIREHAARGFTAVIPARRLEAVKADPRVVLVERDYVMQLIRPIESQARPGGGGGSGGQTTPWGITRIGGAGDGTGKTAWILDTGVDLDHPDLNVDAGCSTSFAGSSPDDKNGHGTHVAGTIGALNNDIGVVGVAAGARICAVQVLGASGSGSYADIVDGVDYVAANGASGDVANMSLGGSGSNSGLENAIRDASNTVKFSLAAGNSAAHANNYTPARVNGSNIYTISAVGKDDVWASFSNFGNPPVDYAAPGVGIPSTYKGGGYKSLSGTSMAAPHVAGILLLGAVHSDGTAKNDPDGNPDPIAHR